jgi:lysophospholipase L1-like esterase
VNFSTIVGRLMRPLLRRSKQMRRTQFEILPPVPGAVVFLGDSITEGGIWNEWFPEFPTLNRGIGGDTVGEVLQRLEDALHRPRAISLLIGTNDLGGIGPSAKVEDIARQLGTLLTRIRELVPDAPLFVNSVMPRSKGFRTRVQHLNRRYEQLAAAHGATYIDLWAPFVTPDGRLRKELTSDGLHLNGEGYRIWVDILRPHLAELEPGC